LKDIHVPPWEGMILSCRLVEEGFEWKGKKN